MNPQDLIAARRSLVIDGAQRRLVPSAAVYREMYAQPLELVVDELNQPGVLPTGLKASIEHLVILAAASALRQHKHFTSLVLPGGSLYESERAVLVTALDGPGSGAFGLVACPDERPLADAVAELDASEADGYPRFEGEARKSVLQSRTRPIKYRLLVDVLTEGLSLVRDRVKLPERLIRIAVEQTGNFVVHPLHRHGVDSASVSLTGPRPAHLLVCAVSNLPTGSKGEAHRVIKIGLAFDMRIFEPWEAAQFLADVADLLSDPRASLA